MFSEESRVLVKTKKAKRHSENTKGLEMLENLGISEIRVGGFGWEGVLGEYQWPALTKGTVPGCTCTSSLVREELHRPSVDVLPVQKTWG